MVSIHPIKGEKNEKDEQLAIVMMDKAHLSMLVEYLNDENPGVYLSGVPIVESEPVVNGRVQKKESLNGD